MVFLIAVRGLPLIEQGAPLADFIVDAIRADECEIESTDVLVIAQKIVSKAEGRMVQVDDAIPSPEARRVAQQSNKDPHLVEWILRESKEVLRVGPGVLIVEDRRGFVCANAGVDRSNVQQKGTTESVTLLPVDPDASARSIRSRVYEITGRLVPVIINDSHGRAWREGTVGVAIGVSGMPAAWDRRGDIDLTGYTLQNTVIGLADELASAASLVMGPASEGVPAVLVRGVAHPKGDGNAKQLQRPRERDFFR